MVIGVSTQVAWGSGTNATESDRIRPSGASLSERQRTIVIMMGRGLCNKRIARQLGISPETVKWHATAIGPHRLTSPPGLPCDALDVALPRHDAACEHFAKCLLCHCHPLRIA
jgi:hypothetical protein